MACRTNTVYSDSWANWPNNQTKQLPGDKVGTMVEGNVRTISRENNKGAFPASCQAETECSPIAFQIPSRGDNVQLYQLDNDETFVAPGAVVRGEYFAGRTPSGNLITFVTIQHPRPNEKDQVFLVEENGPTNPMDESTINTLSNVEQIGFVMDTAPLCLEDQGAKVLFNGEWAGVLSRSVEAPVTYAIVVSKQYSY